MRILQHQHELKGAKNILKHLRERERARGKEEKDVMNRQSLNTVAHFA